MNRILRLLGVLSVVLIFAHPQLGLAGSQEKPLYQMSETEINQFLKSIHKKPFLERLDLVSARAKSTPYLLGPLGEGKNAPYDKDPLIDLTKVDCVTFCEQSLALALSPDYQTAFKTLQKIRYKNGEIKMETRNHYTMADWIPNNAWLIKDITPQLPGAQPLTQTISHTKLFADLKYEGIKVREKDRKMTIAYIPEDKLNAILPRLRTGDMGILIMQQPGIFAAHTGLMIQRKDKTWVFRNATSIGPKQVVDTPFSELVTYLQKSQRLIGMSFARPQAQ